jgi:nitrite reductase/ring-hydroxylating ferredoxin subunit
MTWMTLAKTGTIPENSAREFAVNKDDTTVELFVIHINGRFFAYVNRCPHTGINLNWMPGQFFDINNQFIQCSTHGALFRFDDGFCVRGPCAGASLQSLPLKIDNDEIHVQVN